MSDSMQSFLGRHVRSGVMVLFWLILLLLGFQVLSGNGRSKPKLDVYNSYLTSTHFAIVEDLSKGENMFFGTADGQALVKVKSNQRLSGPLIVNSSRLLFVEEVFSPIRRFSLLELNITASKISCGRLFSSDQYIGVPAIMSGKHASEILFFSGQVFAGASGNPVPTRRLSSYRDGMVSVFYGSAFSTISRLAQIDEDRFLGVSFSYDTLTASEAGSSPYRDLQNNSLLAEGHIRNQSLEVKPAAIGRLKLENVSGVSSNPDIDTVVIRSADFSKNGSYTRFTIVQNSQIESAESFLLPSELSASGLFLSKDANDKIRVAMITVNEDISDIDRSAYISEYVNGKPENTRLIKLNAASVFDTKNCRAK